MLYITGFTNYAGCNLGTDGGVVRRGRFPWKEGIPDVQHSYDVTFTSAWTPYMGTYIYGHLYSY